MNGWMQFLISLLDISYKRTYFKFYVVNLKDYIENEEFEKYETY